MPGTINKILMASSFSDCPANAVQFSSKPARFPAASVAEHQPSQPLLPLWRCSQGWRMSVFVQWIQLRSFNKKVTKLKEYLNRIKEKKIQVKLNVNQACHKRIIFKYVLPLIRAELSPTLGLFSQTGRIKITNKMNFKNSVKNGKAIFFSCLMWNLASKKGLKQMHNCYFIWADFLHDFDGSEIWL